MSVGGSGVELGGISVGVLRGGSRVGVFVGETGIGFNVDAGSVVATDAHDNIVKTKRRSSAQTYIGLNFILLFQCWIG